MEEFEDLIKFDREEGIPLLVSEKKDWNKMLEKVGINLHRIQKTDIVYILWNTDGYQLMAGKEEYAPNVGEITDILKKKAVDLERSVIALVRRDGSVEMVKFNRFTYGEPIPEKYEDTLFVTDIDNDDYVQFQ